MPGVCAVVQIGGHLLMNGGAGSDVRLNHVRNRGRSPCASVADG